MGPRKRDGKGAAPLDAEGTTFDRWEFVEPVYFAKNQDDLAIAAVWEQSPGIFYFKIPEGDRLGMIAVDSVEVALKDVEGTLSDLGYKFKRI